MNKKVWYLQMKIRNLSYKFGYRPIKSSFPFISGDTYRLKCDVDLSGLKIFDLPSVGLRSVFIQTFQVLDFYNFLCKSELNLESSIIVIHNGDEVPSIELLSKLALKVKFIYSVNWLGVHPKIKAIPIGLENIRFLRNGIPSDYLSIINSGLTPFEERPINLLVAFSLHTNMAERSTALQAAKRIQGVKVCHEFLTPGEYRMLVSKSKYVLSPPGNGPDCHRTWEAIYLGAIPIVHSKAWPFSSVDLPVEQVSDWNELESLVSKKFSKGVVTIKELNDLFLVN